MPEYVLVPVPEEHVQAVKQYLTWGGKAPEVVPWTAATIAGLLAAVDEPTRALLEGVASDIERDHATRVNEAADQLGCSDREALGVVIELNETVKQVVDDQNFVVWPRRGPAEESEGHRIRNWVIGITDEAAALIRTHADASGAAATP